MCCLFGVTKDDEYDYRFNVETFILYDYLYCQIIIKLIEHKVQILLKNPLMLFCQ